MSCVVLHKDGWGIGDTAVTNHPGNINPCLDRKVFKFANYALIGSVGDHGIEELLEDVLTDATENPQTALKAICKWLKDQYLQGSGKVDVDILYVDMQHNLRVITNTGATLKPQDQFYVGGSGEHCAYGYLKAVEKLKGKITMDDAADAIVLASTRTEGVNNILHGVSLFGQTFSDLHRSI